MDMPYLPTFRRISSLDLHRLVWIIFAATAFDFTETCAPVKEITGLNEKLQDLETQLSVSSYASLDLEPIMREPDNRGSQVLRAAVNRRFMLTYNLTFNVTGEFLIRWEHNYRELSYINCTLNQQKNDSSGAFALLIEPSLIQLIIHEMSPSTAGLHQFSLIDEARHVMQSNQTILRPVFDARDVFHIPMENVSAVVGETVNFRCYVRFNESATEKTWNRIVWRHGDQIVYTARENPFGVPDGTHDYNLQTQAMAAGGRVYRLIIKSARQSLAGRYECWFKPDEQYQEWLVQSAFLYVSKS